MKKGWPGRLCMVAGLLFLLTSSAGTTYAAQALISVEVPPGKWKGARLKNLPKEAKIQIKVESSGSLDVILIHGDELKRYPAAVSPEFQGSVERKLSFSVAIPKAGDYYVILDNRQNSESRKVRLLIRAERGKKPEPDGAKQPADPAKKGKETEI